MCRSVEDCALVLHVIQGAEAQDPTTVDFPFNWDATLDVKRLRVGYLASAFKDTRQTKQVDANDAATLEKLRSMELNLIPLDLPEGPIPDLFLIILADEAAALHRPLATDSTELKRQDRVIGNRAARSLVVAGFVAQS